MAKILEYAHEFKQRRSEFLTLRFTEKRKIKKRCYQT